MMTPWEKQQLEVKTQMSVLSLNSEYDGRMAGGKLPGILQSVKKIETSLYVRISDRISLPAGLNP